MQSIIIFTTVHAPLELVWTYWTEPKHLVKWNHASDDWESFDAKTDLRVGGQFSCTMAAKDRSAQFVFGGTYTAVTPYKHLAYRMEDGRTVTVDFVQRPDGVHVSETFELEQTHSEEQQREGWQAILNNFKKYAEEHKH